MSRKSSQKVRVLQYLRGGNSITPFECLKMGCGMRLSDIVFCLKKTLLIEGKTIRTDIVHDGELRYAKYSLVGYKSSQEDK
jgi:hypothetical protein